MKSCYKFFYHFFCRSSSLCQGFTHVPNISVGSSQMLLLAHTSLGWKPGSRTAECYMAYDLSRCKCQRINICQEQLSANDWGSGCINPLVLSLTTHFLYWPPALVCTTSPSPSRVLHTLHTQQISKIIMLKSLSVTLVLLKWTFRLFPIFHYSHIHHLYRF